MNWTTIWESIKNFFTNNYIGIIKFFAVLILGIIAIKIILNITKKIMDKTKMEKVTQGFLCGILKFCLYLILFLSLLNIIGISITGILTALSALVLAIGMALQNNISNLANGIVIISSHMFKKGDYISVDGVEGSIHDINFLFTTIMSTDNKKITLPNSTIVNSAVTNYGANNLRRVDFSFCVAYESDVETVKKIVIDVMKSNGKVRLEKDLFCRLKTLNESSIDFFAYCWVDNEDYWDVYYYITENVFNEFKRHNISIPYNQIEIRERKDKVVMPVLYKKLPERVEKVRAEERHLFDLENDDLMTIFKSGKKKNKDLKNIEKDNINIDNKDNTIENTTNTTKSKKSNTSTKVKEKAKSNSTTKAKKVTNK